MSETINRRSLLQRAFGGAGALFVFGAVKEPRVANAALATPFGYNNCVQFFRDASICAGGTTSTCRVQYGPPSTCQSTVSVYSPSSWYVNTTACKCSGCGKCGWFQIRGAVTNAGTCSGRCV